MEDVQTAGEKERELQFLVEVALGQVEELAEVSARCDGPTLARSRKLLRGLVRQLQCLKSPGERECVDLTMEQSEEREALPQPCVMPGAQGHAAPRAPQGGSPGSGIVPRAQCQMIAGPRTSRQSSEDVGEPPAPRATVNAVRARVMERDPDPIGKENAAQRRRRRQKKKARMRLEQEEEERFVGRDMGDDSGSDEGPRSPSPFSYYSRY